VSAEHDTHEAVEAMCNSFRFFPVQQREAAAAMLRRLEARAAAAERHILDLIPKEPPHEERPTLPLPEA
jgi:hypothetical protein